MRHDEYCSVNFQTKINMCYKLQQIFIILSSKYRDHIMCNIVFLSDDIIFIIICQCGQVS